jgi:hypothetical protein
MTSILKPIIAPPDCLQKIQVITEKARSKEDASHCLDK